MTTMPEEKTMLLECLWCHNSCNANDFSPEDSSDRPCCPVCGEPLTLVDADSPGEPTEFSHTFPDEEVADHWLAANWD